jgi:hypothetical protein
MTAWPAKPAATDVVAHATLKDVGSHDGGGSSAALDRECFNGPKSQDLWRDPARVRPATHALISDLSSRQNTHQILPTFATAPTMISTKIISHHMTSIELCSTSSRLSLRSTQRAAALTRPPRNSSSH